jgi:hypothetical protein
VAIAALFIEVICLNNTGTTIAITDKRTGKARRHHQNCCETTDPAFPRSHLHQKIVGERCGKERDSQHAAAERDHEFPPAESTGDQQHRRREDEDERHERLAEAERNAVLPVLNGSEPAMPAAAYAASATGGVMSASTP